ncbi:MAG TPA: pectate lyase [Polyangiaceae bacterium]
MVGVIAARDPSIMQAMPELYRALAGFVRPGRVAGLLGIVVWVALGCSDGAPLDDETSAGGTTSTGGSTSPTGGTGAPTGGTGGHAGVAVTGGMGPGGSSGSAAGGASAGGSSAGSSVGGASNSGGGATATGGTSGSSAGSAGGGAGGAAGSSGTTGGSAGNAGTIVLDQTGNFIYEQLETYKSWLSTASGDAAKLTADRTFADNMVSWQIPNGGFDKGGQARYGARWNGSAPRSAWTGENGVEVGTLDNDATVTEIMFLADVYERSSAAAYRDAARRALDFVLTMQYSSGGFPQVHPARANVEYSSYVTFNDDAMARALVLLHQITRQAPPLDGDLFTAEQRTRAATAITKAVGYILASQIVQGGTKTVWCAQHDPTSHVPRGARSYELPSKSGKESVGVVGFLMTQPQTPEIVAAVRAAIAWFKSDAVKKANTAYVSRPSSSTDDDYNPIQSRSGSTMWCRFYEVADDRCFFSGRLSTDSPPGNGKQYDIMEIEPERRYGYEWGGAYGTRLFAYTDSVGY